MTEAARTDWKQVAMKAKGRIASIYEENREQIRFATDTVEVWGAAGFMGWIHGRNGGIPKRLGIPLDLGLTGVLKLVAFMGWAGKYSADLHGLGNGFGAYYFGTMGLDIGQTALKNAKAADAKAGKTVTPDHPLTDKEAHDQNLDTRTNTIVAGAQSRSFGTGGVRQSRAAQPVAVRNWY
jgi:hypothetical protein